jgi:hypothetical protein
MMFGDTTDWFVLRVGQYDQDLHLWPRPCPGRDIEIRRAKQVQTRSIHCSTYGVAEPSVGLNDVPDFHIA